jgi:hypothetical protein
MAWQLIGHGKFPLAPAMEKFVDSAQARPSDPRFHAVLGRALANAGRYGEAEPHFERALSLGGNGFRDWSGLAKAILHVHGAKALLRFCDERWHGSREWSWHYLRAIALERGRRHDEAFDAFIRAIELGDPQYLAVRRLFTVAARNGDGAVLLKACEALPKAAREASSARAYRALAHSLMGRSDEAAASVDPERATMRFAFTPPAEFGDLDAFHAGLVARLLADLPPAARDAQAVANYKMSPEPGSELAVLHQFVRRSYADYLASVGERSGVPGLPQTLDGTQLGCGAFVVRRQGRNGQHIHPGALLTSVYHVQVPQVAQSGAGDLILGVCDEIAPGHSACWGQRRIKAQPGMLTIFPAHFFHDVDPTGSDMLRIAIVSDLSVPGPR